MSVVNRVSPVEMKITISVFSIACTVKLLSWVYIEDKVIIYHYHLAAVFFIVSKKLGEGSF